MNNPCFKCKHKGCGSYHDECPDYQAYRQKKLKEYDRRKLTSHMQADFSHLYYQSAIRRK